MAEAIRPGGVYQISKDQFVSASGEPVAAPGHKGADLDVAPPSVPRRAEAKDDGASGRRAREG